MKTEFRYGRKIRQQRESRAWTQEHLAAVAGVETRTIQRAERDQTKSPETLKAIASAFDVDVSELGTAWRVAESRLKRVHFVDTSRDFIDEEEQGHRHGFTRRIMAPLRDQFKNQIDDLCDYVFEDRDVIDPSEPELWNPYIRYIKGPLEKLFGMGFAFYLVDEQIDLFLPALNETIKPTTDHIDWHIRHFALVHKSGCFQMSKTEPLHRFDQKCQAGGRAFLRALKEPKTGVYTYTNVLFVLPEKGTRQDLVTWCDTCFPLLPDGNRISVGYLEQIGLTLAQLTSRIDNVTGDPYLEGLS
jgi:transcriptional regulator with XRE-family HTH domain